MAQLSSEAQDIMIGEVADRSIAAKTALHELHAEDHAAPVPTAPWHGLLVPADFAAAA